MAPRDYRPIGKNCALGRLRPDFTFPPRAELAVLPSRPIDATLSVTKAARLWACTNTIRAWSDAGRLRYYRINPRGDRRYRLGDLQRFLAAAESGLPDNATTESPVRRRARPPSQRRSATSPASPRCRGRPPDDSRDGHRRGRLRGPPRHRPRPARGTWPDRELRRPGAGRARDAAGAILGHGPHRGDRDLRAARRLAPPGRQRRPVVDASRGASARLRRDRGRPGLGRGEPLAETSDDVRSVIGGRPETAVRSRAERPVGRAGHRRRPGRRPVGRRPRPARSGGRLLARSSPRRGSRRRPPPAPPRRRPPPGRRRHRQPPRPRPDPVGPCRPRDGAVRGRPRSCLPPPAERRGGRRRQPRPLPGVPPVGPRLPGPVPALAGDRRPPAAVRRRLQRGPARRGRPGGRRPGGLRHDLHRAAVRRTRRPRPPQRLPRHAPRLDRRRARDDGRPCDAGVGRDQERPELREDGEWAAQLGRSSSSASGCRA